MQAVARQFLGRDVIANVAGLGPLGQEFCDEAAELLLSPADVAPSMHDGCQFIAAMGLTGNQREGFEYCLQSLTGRSRLISRRVTGSSTVTQG